MTVPIIFIYGLGLAFFILGCEGMGETKRDINNIIYLGFAFFLNLIGYYVSYSSADYVNLAYIPLAFLAIIIIMLIYSVWQLIPVRQSWDEQTEEGEF
jgi:hypothetical protein